MAHLHTILSLRARTPQGPSRPTILTLSSAAAGASTSSLATLELPLRTRQSVFTHSTTRGTFTNPVAEQHSGLLPLPDQVKARILSYVSRRDIPSVCGDVCQDLQKFIEGSECRIAELVAQRELARLVAQVDETKDFRDSVRTGKLGPDGFAQFLRGLQMWTGLRGIILPGVRKTVTAYGNSVQHLLPFHQSGYGQQKSSIEWSAALLLLQVRSKNQKSRLEAKSSSSIVSLMRRFPISQSERDAWEEEGRRMIGYYRSSKLGFQEKVHSPVKSVQAIPPRFRLTTSKASVHSISLEPTIRDKNVEELNLPELPDD